MAELAKENASTEKSSFQPVKPSVILGKFSTEIKDNEILT
jgi:hypothetical protein